MRVGRPDAARILAADFPALHAILKGGGWRVVDDGVDIDDGIWAAMTAPQQRAAETWIARCLGRSPHIVRRIQAATTIDDIKAILIDMAT